jgi:uncharacterized membrane protein HdeD (DUF308 family)
VAGTRGIQSVYRRREKGWPMIILGIILLVLGYLLPIPILATIGWILLVVGALLFVLGAVGRPVGGRQYWY